ncbi:hypothetical protein [Aquidulcibacter sp.]|uniref:hypothetical protein n=1 Tax=Aquidulcibacter sp. TaxID=2052990 RepID=UPI0025C25CB3|nr:hypothetical protein [Aquidulcibacter sp.]MCA3064727.1 hypothetical protein [Rhodocyclaceae bacterium]MCA3694282.1 hypothetical protein [Aquidulcibacter sp.]
MKRVIAASVLLIALPAFAGTAYLKRQWFDKNGNQMCEYDNGTVLNMGAKPCPSSIKT